MKKEDDLSNPLGFYGKSKLEGELVLNKLASNWCIARTSTPFWHSFYKEEFSIVDKRKFRGKKRDSSIGRSVYISYIRSKFIQNVN